MNNKIKTLISVIVTAAVTAAADYVTAKVTTFITTIPVITPVGTFYQDVEVKNTAGRISGRRYKQTTNVNIKK